MTLEEIKDLVKKYDYALQREADKAIDVRIARDAAEFRRAEVLLAAYQSGAIDGKNETMRKMQEAVALDADNALACLETYLRQEEACLSAYEVARKAAETEVSLTKAWLYSQSGGKRYE